jgi:hypothetical protein
MPDDFFVHLAKGTLVNTLFKNIDENFLDPCFNDVRFVPEKRFKES